MHLHIDKLIHLLVLLFLFFLQLFYMSGQTFNYCMTWMFKLVVLVEEYILLFFLNIFETRVIGHFIIKGIVLGFKQIPMRNLKKELKPKSKGAR